MAYGKNAPFGLRPILGGNYISERLKTYKIYASADGLTTFATSLFTGDPVQMGTSQGATPAINGLLGTIRNYVPVFTDGTPSTFSPVSILGVFQGCEYYSYINGALTLNKSSFWPGGTQVVPGTEIIAYVLDDQDIIYDVQVSTHIDAAANTFVSSPIFPNMNNAVLASSGGIGSNFALNIGGGTNFNTILIAGNPAGYANNPAAGNPRTGQSAFYLDVNTSTVGPYNNHDYGKNIPTMAVRVIDFSPNPDNVAAPGLTLQTTPFINVMVQLNNPVYGNLSPTPVIVA